jgi:pSer/pThr/pTyr-binding forkhead associated (FHA) protein
VAQPVALSDPTLTVSGTHFAVGRNGDALWVEDRKSTNGTAIEHPDGAATRLVPGQRYDAPLGTTVHFGRRSLEIRRL